MIPLELSDFKVGMRVRLSTTSRFRATKQSINPINNIESMGTVQSLRLSREWPINVLWDHEAKYINDHDIHPLGSYSYDPQDLIVFYENNESMLQLLQDV